MTARLKMLSLLVIIGLPLVLLGCGEEQGPAEKAGKKIDRALQKAADKAEELTK